jgi:hypothetical protein
MIQLNKDTGKRRAIQRFGSQQFDNDSFELEPFLLRITPTAFALARVCVDLIAFSFLFLIGLIHNMQETKAEIDASDQSAFLIFSKRLAESLELVAAGDAEIQILADRIQQEKQSLEKRVAGLLSLKAQNERETFLMQIAFEKRLNDHDARANEERQRTSELRESLKRERERIHADCVQHEQIKQELADRLLEKQALAQQVLELERNQRQSDCAFDVDYDPPQPWLPVFARMEAEERFEVVLDPASDEFACLETLLNRNIAQHSDAYGTEDGLTPGTPPGAFRVVQINRVHDMRLWRQYCVHKQMLIDRHRDAGGVPALAGSQYLARKPMLTPLTDPASNEYLLFHGTSAETAHDLLSYPGYDARVSRVTGMFGGGFYLAENASKSNQYVPCPRCGGNAIMSRKGCSAACFDHVGGGLAKRYFMIVYRASLGDVHVVRHYNSDRYKGPTYRPVRRPPLRDDCRPFDSVLGERASNLGDGGGKTPLRFREVILYDDGRAAYPEYVVQYERLPEPDARLAGVVTRDETAGPAATPRSALAAFMERYAGILLRSRSRQV